MSRSELSYNAKLAEHAERYADMIQTVKELVEVTGGRLNEEERTLLSVAYKQAVGERRQAWRVICHYEDKQRAKSAGGLDLIEEYKAVIKQELHDLCADIASVVDQKLMNDDESDEIKVFYHKMKGDYFRYMAETNDQSAIENSRSAYMRASELAAPLPANNPVKVGLALNFSVFYYEVLKEKEEACKLAKTTFDEALPILEELDERSYKEATSILGLIKDNLTIWSSEED